MSAMKILPADYRITPIKQMGFGETVKMRGVNAIYFRSYCENWPFQCPLPTHLCDESLQFFFSTLSNCNCKQIENMDHAKFVFRPDQHLATHQCLFDKRHVQSEILHRGRFVMHSKQRIR